MTYKTILSMTSSALISCFIGIASGCDGKLPASKKTMHEKVGWKAEEFFDDPMVIQLCHAIEAKDLDEMTHLVDKGADVNAKGKGNMTPLLWSFPDNNLPRFKWLLENGADPNVKITSNLNARKYGFQAGNSVTLMASKANFPGYFNAVFENGGDPNIREGGGVDRGATPIFFVIKYGTDKKKRIQRLLEKGADVDASNANGTTPAIQACTMGGQYSIALYLVKAGADTKSFNFSNLRLIHILLFEKNRRGKIWTPEQRRDFAELVEYLENKHGETLVEAQADMDLWNSWPGKPVDKKERIKKVILARDAEKAAIKGSQ